MSTVGGLLMGPSDASAVYAGDSANAGSGASPPPPVEEPPPVATERATGLEDPLAAIGAAHRLRARRPRASPANAATEREDSDRCMMPSGRGHESPDPNFRKNSAAAPRSPAENSQLSRHTLGLLWSSYASGAV